MANLLQKLVFRLDIICYHSEADIESQKSVHTLFDKYLDHILVKFEQNRMIQDIQKFDLFGKKWLKIFEKESTTFWKTFL